MKKVKSIKCYYYGIYNFADELEDDYLSRF